jgi:hypothetical protein
MYSEVALRSKGMKILIDNLGKVEAERFIALMIREPFNYTEWHNGLFEGMSVRELSSLAMKDFKANNE